MLNLRCAKAESLVHLFKAKPQGNSVEIKDTKDGQEGREILKWPWQQHATFDLEHHLNKPALARIALHLTSSKVLVFNLLCYIYAVRVYMN